MFSKPQSISAQDKGAGYIYGTLRPAISEEEKAAGVVGYTIRDWKALTLKRGGGTRLPLKLEHDEDVGWILSTTVDENHMLCVHAQIDISTQRGQDIHRCILDGTLPALSIGFDSVPSSSGMQRINTGHHVGLTDNPRDLTATILVRCAADDPEHTEPIQPFQTPATATPVMSSSSASSSSPAAPAPAASSSSAAAPVAPAPVADSSAPASSSSNATPLSSLALPNPTGAAPSSSSSSSSSPSPAAPVSSPPLPFDPEILKNPEAAARLIAELLADRQQTQPVLEESKARIAKKAQKRARAEEAAALENKARVEAQEAYLKQYGGDDASAKVLMQRMTELASASDFAPVVKYTGELTSTLEKERREHAELKSRAAADQAELAIRRAAETAMQQQQALNFTRPPVAQVNDNLAKIRAARAAAAASGKAAIPSALTMTTSAQQNSQEARVAQLQAELQRAMAGLAPQAEEAEQPIEEVDAEPEMSPEYVAYMKAEAAGDKALALKHLIAMNLKDLMPGIQIRCNANGKSVNDVLAEAASGGVMVAGTVTNGPTDPAKWNAFHTAFFLDAAPHCRNKLAADPAYLAKKGVRYFAPVVQKEGRAEYYRMETAHEYNRRGMI